MELEKWGSPVLVNTSIDMAWLLPTVIPEGDSEENARGFLALNLTRENQDEAAAFFVNEGGQFLLDWDATTGWCEVPWADVRSTRPQSAKIMRARITKKPSYDAIDGGVEQSGYLLSNDDGGQFIFAFIPLDSEENKKHDKTLRDLLNYGQLTTVVKGNVRVTVKVRYGDGSGGGSRFEIVDYLHKGWVRP